MNSTDTYQITHFFKTRKKDVFFLTLGILLGVVLKWDIAEIFIFVVLMWAILGHLSVQFLASIGLFWFIFVPILIAFERNEQAEQFAIYAYYFLVMAVIRGVIEVRKERNNT